MVNKLQFLRSLNAGITPAGLSVGEIAFNLADKKLFVGDGTSTITRLSGATESVTAGTGYFESDLSVLTANAYTDQKIAELIDSAPQLLNTLNELAAALGDDPNFVTTVTNSVATVQSNLNSEISRAQTAEGSLQASLSTEVSRAQAAESQLASDLAAEVARAEAAEEALASDLATEAAARVAGDAAVAADLATEVSRAQAAENLLRADLTSETQRAQYAEGQLATGLADETSARQAAVSAEQARAIAAESALSSRIAAIENGIDLGSFDPVITPIMPPGISYGEA